MQNAGRIVITTDVPEITYKNVLDVVRKAYAVHTQNATKIQGLLDYDAGVQPIIRKNPKTYRPDIDCECVDNVAHQASDFWMGFAWGNPITLVQNGDGKERFIADAISELNKQYELLRIKSKTQELGRYVTVDAVCNVYVDVNMDWKEGNTNNY